LTFDDGNCSDYEIAFSLLLEAGYPAVFFINTATVGTKGFLNWQQVAEMQRAGMSFQSHGHDHLYLSRLPLREIERQLRLSRAILADRLGVDVQFLAVPYGDLSSEVLQVAKTTGYRSVCTSRSWPAQPGMSLTNRVAVYSLTGQRAYARLLARSLVSYSFRAGKDTTLSLTRRALRRFFGLHLGAAVLEDPS
jgi:peptidoglycan/xylan/chitin deacetylase (PgdA/CDA1 family)